MKNNLFLAVGDIHIKPEGLIWKNVREVKGDVAYALGQIVKIAKEKGVTRLVLSGDVFDTQTLTSSQVYYFRRFIELGGFDEVLYIQGQHDRSTPPWIELLCPSFVRVNHLHNFQLYLEDISIVGLDFIECDCFAKALESVPASDILVVHQTWDDFVKGSLCTRAVFATFPFKLVLSGDIHTPFHSEEEYRFYCLGSIYPTRISEFYYDKYVYLIDSDLNVETINLKQRQFLEFIVTDRSSLDSFCDKLAQLEPLDIDCAFPLSEEEVESLRKPLVLLNLSKTYWASGDHDLIKSRLDELRQRKTVVLRVELSHKDNPVSFVRSVVRRGFSESLFKECKENIVREFPFLEGSVGFLFDNLLERQERGLSVQDLVKEIKEKIKCSKASG